MQKWKEGQCISFFGEYIVKSTRLEKAKLPVQPPMCLPPGQGEEQVPVKTISY